MKTSIEFRKYLSMLVAGIQGTYARDAFFSAHVSRFQALQSRIQPLIANLPILESNLRACNRDNRKIIALCEGFALAMQDEEEIWEVISDLGGFIGALHAESERNRSTS